MAGLKLPKWNLTFSPEKVEKLQQFNFTEVNVTLNCVENCNLIDDPGSLQLDLTNEKANIASLQVKVCNYEICMNKQWQREHSGDSPVESTPEIRQSAPTSLERVRCYF